MRISYHVSESGLVQCVSSLKLNVQAQLSTTKPGLVVEGDVRLLHAVHRHQGRVWARAAPEEGATFSFTLAANGEDYGK